MNCLYCNDLCIKKGLYKGVQKYRCKSCLKHQRSSYRNLKYYTHTEDQIVLLNNIGLGTSGISRVLALPRTSVQRRIKKCSDKKEAPLIFESGQSYEVDELYTFVKRKS